MATMKKCPKCGELKDSRGMNKHLEACTGTLDQENQNQENQDQEIDKKESIKKCISCSSDQIVRIDDFIEKVKALGTVNVNMNKLKKVYDDGYTHVCGNCGEVLK